MRLKVGSAWGEERQQSDWEIIILSLLWYDDNSFDMLTAVRMASKERFISDTYELRCFASSRFRLKLLARSQMECKSLSSRVTARDAESNLVS